MSASDMSDQREAYVESVLTAVEQIPAGRVASYGDIAEYIGTGGPRQVGRVMALYGSTVAWWRVVRSDGQAARCHENEALRLLSDESTPLNGERVRMKTARFLDWSHLAPDADANADIDTAPD